MGAQFWKPAMMMHDAHAVDDSSCSCDSKLWIVKRASFDYAYAAQDSRGETRCFRKKYAPCLN